MRFKKIISTILISTILSTSFSFAEAKVISRGNTNIPEMALTFDDGYSVEKINKIVKVLNKHNVKGTFFFVGSFIASNKELIKDLEKDGHLIVSHSFSHPDYTKISDKAIVGEMENTKIVYTKATNKKIKPYFRPPYGGYDDRVLKTLGKNHDLYVVMWSIDTLDWKGTSATKISNSVLSNAGNGKIVLMHTTKNVNTDKALDSIITGLHKKGYKLVTIDDMIANLPEEEQIKSIRDDYLKEKEQISQNNKSKNKKEIRKNTKTKRHQ